MKSSQILLLLLSILPLLIFDAARAQTVSKVSVAAKGAFEFEKSYPKAADGKTPFNLLKGFLEPKNGQKINYFVFRITDEMIKFQRSISMNTFYADVNLCPTAVDRTVSVHQPLGNFLEPIVGRTDLLPYVKRASLIQLRNYLYVAIDSNLRSYSPKGADQYGYEWLPIAVESRQVCLTISVGRMGHGAFLSQPINITRLAEFVFLDSK
ncbi:hypothetical protein [Mesorhizobium sp. M1295]|uniref:hypothetical protein n=1 Tax=Mesorhizobium sp. M1295 TaxID=2957076 RepID=UPI00333B139C